MAGTPDEALAGALRPGERVTLRQPALLSGRFALSHRDLLFLTNERALLAVKEKEGYRLANSWNLEELPPVLYETHSGQHTVVILAGTKILIKDFNAKTVAVTIEQAKAVRVQALQAARPPPAPAPATVIREVHEKETIREIVKVPCRYCHQLNLMNSAKCLSCGAPLG